MNRNRWILAGVVVLVVLVALSLFWYYMPTTATVAKPPVVAHKHAPVKKAVVKPAKPAPAVPTPQVGTPTPAERGVGAAAPATATTKSAPSATLPQTIINIYNGCCQVVPSAPQPAPTPRASSPAPLVPPTVQPPTNSSSCSEADNYYCGTPPPAVAQQSSMSAPPAPANVKQQKVLFQLNIWGGAYGYGSTYGWTPGHEELRYDPRAGTYYRVWVAHPQPGY